MAGTWLKAIAGIAIAAVVATSTPLAAWADEALGDVESPRAQEAAADGLASSQGSGDAASEAPAQDREVVVSAEGDAALMEGSTWAIDEFTRAQVGSKRAVGGVDRGYSYYVGGTAGNLSAINAGTRVVVYVPKASADEFGIDVASEEGQAALRSYLVALDDGKAKGNARLSAVDEWVFTTEQVIEIDGVRYEFDQEFEPGEFYACVIGTDGSDVTDRSNPSFVSLVHADFARIVNADDVDIVLPATGLAALGEFLGGIDYSPLWVTLKTTGVAIVFIFALGLAAAYISLRIPARAQDVADSIFTIPMVLPPTVCGFLLLLALGRNTAVGQWFIDIGFPLIFSWPATVIAAVVVAFPLMYRSARGAFENLDSDMLDAARTLGWSNRKIFFKLMLPLSWSSIAAGTVLSFARALGEFGATLFLAGNYLGITRTIPIAIYFEWMNGNTDVAIFWTVVIMAFSFVVILFINLWSRRTTKYRRGAEE